ncbi:MAG: CDP-glycerol glycerophosphotransferase family protein [Bifidobacteriaceae bacterium]|jgi:CDP-glycerol glycerophosphotransferase (TagB/SpsB family)|nr:CDP-glycerol glycerophosphotransferase family protein [Bifidobacteriaceae bacterium]
MKTNKNFYIDIIQFKSDNKTVQVFAHARQEKNKPDNIKFLVNGQEKKYHKYIRTDFELSKPEKGISHCGYSIEFTPERESEKKICNFEIISNGKKQYLYYTLQSHLSRFPNNYKEQNGFTFNHNDYYITIKPKKFFPGLFREIKFLQGLTSEYKTKTVWQIAALRLKIRFWKKFYKKLITKQKKKVLLFSDRLNLASDNAEALYRYTEKMNVKKKSANCKFLILPNSADGQRLLHERFSIIEPFSKKHFFYLFICDYNISSSFDSWVYNPFKKYVSKNIPSYFTNLNVSFYFGLLDFKYVFLGHGPTKNNMSGIFRKEVQNFSKILANSKQEAKEFQKNNYQFNDNEIMLTGLPRFDYLSDKKKKNIITIMPTWRKNLLPDKFADGKRVYFDKFKQTDFFQFYNGILNNKDLIKILKEYNYKLNFILHPAFFNQLRDFKSNSKNVLFPKIPYNWKEIINQTKIFITDYSSIAFDFAYTGSCVIYSQFDEDIFFKNQKYLENSLFTYKTNGFGPICKSIEKVTEKLINYIKQDGKIEKQYLSRYKKAFPWHDKNFSKRVCQEL